MNIKSIALGCLSLMAITMSITSAENVAGAYQVIEDKAKIPLLNPSLSERKIAKIRLTNGLEAYLISDPGAEQSAAALSVEVGSWQDPKEYPGMAHFCEHMLFMGTEAYPKEFEYMQYITDHGGLVNASTWPDRTLYMFSINNEAFEGSLDRFSHFFIDPLFLPSCINRELHAVDQEHSKNIEHDGWREYMIFKETGNQNHPNAAFSTGNAATLQGIPQEALKKWYREYYSANRMHLVMISPLPLDELLSLATRDFSRVPEHKTPKIHISEPLFSSQQKGHMIHIQPIKDLRRLSLVWEVPESFAEDLDRRPYDLVAYVLDQESENSLISELKREKLIEDLSVNTDRFSKDQMLFRIDIDLTQQGISQTDLIITRCFQTIARLKEKGIPRRAFDEMQKIAQLNYQYQSREEAFHFVMTESHDMVDEDLQTYPEKLRIPTTYDSAFLAAFIQTLTPQTCLFTLQADAGWTGVEPDRTEKWMQAQYAIKKISNAELVALSQVAPNPLIDLPKANPFVPQQLALCSSVDEIASPLPEIIADDAVAKVYFAQDEQYFVPELYANFGIKTPLIDGTAKSSVLSALYIKAFTEKLSSTLSFAQNAGLSPNFGIKDLKLVLAVQGYSEKAPLLLKEIFQNLKLVTPSSDQFEIYKQMLLSDYENESKELPLRQALDVLSSIIYNDSSTSQEKLKALKNISYEEFLTFSKNLFKSAYIEGLLYGNLQENEAKSLWAELKNTLSVSPYPLEERAKKSILLLPEKHGPYMVIHSTERQGNGVVLLLEEGAFSFEKRAMQQVLSKALQEGFFDTLRTKQQTAYIAKAWDAEVERQLLQFFAVQSSTHHPRDLIARFELFLEDFLKNFQERISSERFETLRNMLITTLQMPPENLQTMGDRLNLLAFTYQGDFDWFAKRIQSLQTLSYDELKEGAFAFLSRDNPRRIAILMEGVLSSDNDFHYEIVSKDDIRDLGIYSTPVHR